jgi:hypothetical protein
VVLVLLSISVFSSSIPLFCTSEKEAFHCLSVAVLIFLVLLALWLIMPPVIPISPAMIPEASKRRLDQTFHQTQALDDSQIHHQKTNLDTLQQLQTAGSSMSDVPTSDSSHQGRRSLPTRAVTDENFDDAYVSFIMYCNPTIALDTDTTELRKTFRAPPKSDGNTFSTFTLFELIRKLEQKEIKTWAQLAIDLGVEPPALDKGQSAQKVQQYAVRLKVSDLYLQSLISVSSDNASIIKACP